jgi:hypothetical protein
MKIFNEDDILDQGIRARIIAEIELGENQTRKDESFKRYEIYKDSLKKYIRLELLKEFDESTVKEMEGRISNINLYKKTVNKKARVYQVAPNRNVTQGNEETFKELIDFINLDTSMKKGNRYSEAFRNALVFARPYKDFKEPEKYAYELRILPPHMFDIVEDNERPEFPRVVILSEYDTDNGNGSDELIADLDEKDKKNYIFWSTKYHFTTDEKGTIISESIENPIQTLPFVSLNKDQDGRYWSMGGEDLIDGTLLTNVLLTDLYFIAKVQGMGIFYLFGKGVPKTLKVGTNRGITMELEEGSPTPQIGFANSSPPLDSHMSLIEQYVAFLLTTNDLGVNAVSSKLDGRSAISGVQELIQNSEPMNAIEDDQECFRDTEPMVVNLITKWHNYYYDKSALIAELMEMGKLPEFDYTIQFAVPQQYKTEDQKLGSLKIKKELGIADAVSIMLEMHPEMSEEQAIEEIRKQMERKLEASNRMLLGGEDEQEGGEGNEDSELELERDSEESEE